MANQPERAGYHLNVDGSEECGELKGSHRNHGSQHLQGTWVPHQRVRVTSRPHVYSLFHKSRK